MSESSHEGFKKRLSSVLDGESEPEALADVCSSWRDDAEARRTWHAYSLIGDVLRSDELATDPARDEVFLAAFRARLAKEPVVLAPGQVHAAPEVVEQPQIAVGAAVSRSGRSRPAASSRRTWSMPVSLAAGVMAVAGVFMVARMSGVLPSDEQAGSITQAALPAGLQATGAVQPVSVAAQPRAQSTEVSVNLGDDAQGAGQEGAQPQVLVANGKLIRDARLDQYLAAHKQFGGSSALGVPSGFLRSATSESPER